MNVELFEAVKRAIRADVKRADINDWRTNIPPPRGPECGIVGCIATWAMLIHNFGEAASPEEIRAFERDAYAIPVAAQKALDISKHDADRLFHVANWPKDLCDAIDATTPQTEEHALAIVAAIDAYMANPAGFMNAPRAEPKLVYSAAQIEGGR